MVTKSRNTLRASNTEVLDDRKYCKQKDKGTIDPQTYLKEKPATQSTYEDVIHYKSAPVQQLT